MRKIGVIGTGKTGSAVAELLGAQSVLFNRSHLPDASSLKELHGAIVFVTPDSAENIMHLLLEAKIAVAWGTTGFSLPDSLDRMVREAGTAWVVASNFSIGMILMKSLIEQTGRHSKLFDHPEFLISETHHTQKKDSPSGTALSWERWLGQPAIIRSERRGDVVGTHTLTLKTEYETITLQHEAKNRSLFASGAIRALHWLLEYPSLRGVYTLEELVHYAHEHQTPAQ